MKLLYEHIGSKKDNGIGSPFLILRLTELDAPGLVSVGVALTQPGMHFTGDAVIDETTARCLGNALIAWANEQTTRR